MGDVAGTNGWTGGQYSVSRALLGLALFVPLVGRLLVGHVAGAAPPSEAPMAPATQLVPNILALVGSPFAVGAVLVAGAALAVLLTIGFFDRYAAALLLYVEACLHSLNPLTNAGEAALGALLLVHLLAPPAPYGSWARRGRPDPGTAWRLPGWLFTALWVAFASGYGYAGIDALRSQGQTASRLVPALLAVAVPLLAWKRALRPWAWCAASFALVAWYLLSRDASLWPGVPLLHLLAFDPGWVRPREAASTETLFYDGDCGLCHRVVRFVLAEDRSGSAFRFAPLQGETFRSTVPGAERAALPDSLVLRTADGALLTRSAGALHLLGRLGGLWRAIGTVAGLFPARFLDALYDLVARIRHRLFRRPADACPIVPAPLRARFDA